MQQNEFELIVSQGKRHVWRTLLSAVFFTGMFYYSYQLFIVIADIGYNEKIGKTYAHLLEIIALCLAGGINFSIMKTVMIDTDQNKLISRFFIGPFSHDRISTVPMLEYVAVFKNARDVFEVNLWYKGNKHYKMYAFQKKDNAFVFASQVAEKLDLELLDATQRGNSRWVERIPQESV